MSQPTLLTPVVPDLSHLFASYSHEQGFWIKERSAPTTKNEEEATCHPLSSALPCVDIARESRSAEYSRNKAKNKARFEFERALKSKRQDRLGRERPTQRTKGGKRSGKRHPVPQDLTTDSEIDYEQNLPVFPQRREAVLAPVRVREDRRISTSIPPKLQPLPKKSPKKFTPLGAYATPSLPESAFNVLAPDAVREFRSYERHRHQTKKNARLTQSRKKKDAGVNPVPDRYSKSGKAENFKNLINLTMDDERTSSEDEIQTPIEVSPSPNIEFPGALAPPAVDMEALITTAKVKYTKGSSKSHRLTISPFLTYYDADPSFEFVKSVPSVVVLDDFHCEVDEEESWEHIWNDELVD